MGMMVSFLAKRKDEATEGPHRGEGPSRTARKKPESRVASHKAHRGSVWAAPRLVGREVALEFGLGCLPGWPAKSNRIKASHRSWSDGV